MESTHSTAPLRMLLGHAERAGLDRAALLVRLGVDPATLDDPDGRIASALVMRLWSDLARACGDPDLGLHLAETAPSGSAGIVEYLSQTCSTVGEAYQKLARYVRLFHDGAELQIERQGMRARVTYSLAEGTPPPRPLADWVVATWVIRGRQFCGVDWVPRQIGFQHRRPPDVREYLRLFRCPVRFGLTESELVVDHQIFDLAIEKADPGLSQLLTRYAEELLERLPEPDHLLARVRVLVIKALPGGEPRLAEVARKLAMSPRTLQRRLRAQDTSLQDVVRHLRDELASQYLGDRRMAIGEIAFLLGFSEPSAFHRSFKRWRGLTPLEYRHQQRAAL